MAGDQYRMPLESGSCTICRCDVESKDHLVAVLGNGSRRSTITEVIFINEVPRYKADSYITVPYDEKHNAVVLRPWRNFPQTVLFHNDCYQLLKQHGMRPTLRQIWTAGDWMEPMPRARFQSSFSPYLPFTRPKDLISYFPAGDPVRRALELVAALPAELQWMIIERSADSLLWRLGSALTFPSTFASLWTGRACLQSKASLDGWVRGRARDRPRETDAPFIRLGVDGLGIRSVELIESLTSPPTDASAGCSWYVIEDRDLGGVAVEGSGDFLRLCTKNLFHMWSTPVRPELSRIRWNVDADSVPPLLQHLARFQHIYRFEAMTGLTVFCWGGSVFAVHQHFREGSSAYDTYRKISWRHREYLSWLYIPLSGREKIQDVWAWPHELGTLALSTTAGRAYTLGCYRVWAEQLPPERLNAGPLTNFVLEEPQLKKISFLGVCHDAPEQPPTAYPVPSIDYRFSAELNCTSYTTDASLENVVRATTFDHIASCEEDWGGARAAEYCHGILLTYGDGSQAVLGECRWGAARALTVTHPTQLCFRRVTLLLEQSPAKIAKRMAIRFATLDDPAPRVPGDAAFGCGALPMRGRLRWWCGEGDGYFTMI